MLDLNTVLGNMTSGQLPLAIGTSFAIESSLGILDKDNFNSENNPSVKDRINQQTNIPVKGKAPVASVREVWINIRTLFRNIYNALEPSVKDVLTPPLAMDAVINEMTQVVNVYAQYSNNIKVIFYVCSHRGMDKVFPHALHKGVNTDKQKHYLELEQHVAFYSIEKFNNIKKFDVKFKGTHPPAIILSHVSVDLLWKSCFESLMLLESHTGNIKKSSEWNTKLTNGKNMPFMPFNFFTIQVFGDNGTFFSPMSHGIKNTVIELATTRRWTPVTTRDKIVADIKTIRDIPVQRLLSDVCSKW